MDDFELQHRVDEYLGTLYRDGQTARYSRVFLIRGLIASCLRTLADRLVPPEETTMPALAPEDMIRAAPWTTRQGASSH